MSYSLVINSKNRIAPTGSPNDATYYFDWAAFQESKYKVTWSIYRPLVAAAAVLTPFQQLLVAKAPWGQYSAASWVSGTNTLTDLTGNGRHATTLGVLNGTVAGNGATAAIAYLSGTTTSTIQWPAGSIPATFTICSITRYSGANRGRVLNGSSVNYLQGHYSGSRGIFFNEGFKQGNSFGTVTDWVNMVATNSVTVAAPNNVLVDGVARAQANGGSGGTGTQPDLRINGPGINAESSDFQFSQLLIWNQVLTAAEMATVSDALTNYLATGVLQ